jgi:hypothetical protein
MRNVKTLVERRGAGKRYASALKGWLIKIKRFLKGIKGVFVDECASHFTILRGALVCRN